MSVHVALGKLYEAKVEDVLMAQRAEATEGKPYPADSGQSNPLNLECI